jgi:hypothetical protein
LLLSSWHQPYVGIYRAMTARIDERIKVGVVFREEGQKREPKWFFWRGRRLNVTKSTYIWREKEGRDIIHKFIVTDGNDLYELSYKTSLPSTPLFKGLNRTRKLRETVDRTNNVFGEYSISRLFAHNITGSYPLLTDPISCIRTEETEIVASMRF